MNDGGNKILVLEKDEKNNLVRRLYDCGFNPVLREGIEPALSKMRDEDFAAVVIRRDNGFIDPLEFILNLREADRHTPVIIIGETDEAYRNQMLRNRSRVYFISGAEDGFHDCLREIIEKQPEDIAGA
jgi:DNA-binding NarL/FixJ family response regulator